MNTTTQQDTQAAANKAAEEGELHDKAIAAAEEWANAEFFHAKNLGAGGPGAAERCNKAEIACRTAINELAADRAARPVANKAEVEPVAYLHDVVCGASGEPDQALSFAPDNFPLAGTLGFISVGYKPLYATPPATTGASTVLTDERMRALYEAWELAEAERRKGEPLDATERAYVVKRCPGASDTYNIAPAAWPAFKAGYEVAAKAGQVAVPGWISVDDRLPDDDCQVLAATWFTMTHEQHQDIVSFRSGTGKFSDNDVTHWMPLPAAPSPAKESK